MKKKPTSKSAFFSLRVLTGLSLCTVGVFVTLIAFAAKPAGNTVARQDQPYQAPAQLDVAAGGNVPIYNAQFLPESGRTDQISQQGLVAPDPSWLQAPTQATSCSL